MGRAEHVSSDEAVSLGPMRPTETLSDKTTELLRERILSGDFSLGERLVEASLARQLGISRGPVRDAIKQLRAEGIVREEPRRGAFVADFTDDDIREIYELRAAIEVWSVRLIVRRRDLAALEELRGILDRLEQAAKDDDHGQFANLDQLFHESLCQLSGNGRLYRVFVSHAAVLGMLLRHEVQVVYSSVGSHWREHKELFEAIQSLDVARAEEACKEHLDIAMERLIRVRRSARTAGA